MKKRTPQLLSILLALCMVLSLLPGTVWAAETSGKCGDNVTWSFSDDTLTIQGTGSMTDYGIGSLPWDTYHNYIRTVIIGDGVTSISSYAFLGFSSLTSVTIPDSVISIKFKAFYDCSSLTSITIPDGVTSIGAQAFGGCSSLANVNIPDSVTSIGDSAFYDCSSLTSITIPDGVTYIAPSAFSCCSSLTSVNIPDNVTSIGASAFMHCRSLVSVNIPASVIYIGGHVFSGCSSLTSINVTNGNPTYSSVDGVVFNATQTLLSIYPAGKNNLSYRIPDLVTSIGDNAFHGCSNLTSVTIPSSITSIGDTAFYGCSNLTSVTIPSSVTSIGGNAFYGCSSLTSVTIPDGVTTIRSYTFSNCSSLTTVTIPGSVTRIETFAFSGCSTLTDVYYSGSETDWKAIRIANNNSPLTNATLHYSGSSSTAPNEGDTPPSGVDTPIGDITLQLDSDTISMGNEAYITAVFTHDDSFQQKDITWSSNDKSIVSIVTYGALVSDKNASSTVTIKGISEGTATITVSLADGRSASCKVTVETKAHSPSKIAVFTTEKSLTVQTGESMCLGFGKIIGDQISENWEQMAIVVSDPTVISLSEYEKTEYGYSIEVTGKKQGATNVTITDTTSGLSLIIVITVRDSYVSTYSYSINDMQSFYPNNNWEKDIQTNIYNLNGMYVNNYNCSKDRNTYTVSFDVYNTKYHFGAVDIYDADGNWIDCEEIQKYSDISGLWDTAEQAYFLVSDTVTGKLLTYEQASYSKQTPISIEVPDGGYFTITNNFGESPGTFLYNSCDIIFDATCTLIDAAADVKKNDVTLSAFSKLLKDEIKKDKTTREQFIDIFKKTAKKEVQKSIKKFAINEIDERYADITGLFENFLNSLDINWKHLFKSVTGMGESAFTKFAGPAGIALKGCFAFSKEGDQLLQAIHLAASLDVPYATVFSSIDEGIINQYGVIVNTNGNIDAESVLQVFRISNDDSIEDMLDQSGNANPQQYELYNICFVKNDQLVQPNGKVTVRIPVPDGMKGDTCNVYRQESDGTWTILSARVEDNYLVFETDHFSLYAVVGEANNLSILTLPNKTQYSVGDILEPDGLVLSLDGKQITDGFVCEPTVLSQEGEQKIAVQYGFSSTEFTVYVQARTKFTDVPADAYYYDAVQWAVEQDITKGTSDTTFSPNNPCTRAQIVTFLYRAAGSPTVTASNPFTDVAQGKYYYDAVLWAVENGITSGTTATTFSPNKECTRAEAVTFLYRAKNFPAVSGTNSFTDVASGSYYTDAVQWAVNTNVTAGTSSTKFSPNQNCTRAQIVTFLYRDRKG